MIENRLPRGLQCENCGPQRLPLFAIGEARNNRGHTIYPWYCLHCGFVTQRYASKAVAKDHGLSKPLKRVYTKSEIGRAEGRIVESNPPCEVCGAEDQTEYHHWAPRHLFGDDCDNWPKSTLCQKCHVRWHQIVTPNMGSPHA